MPLVNLVSIHHFLMCLSQYAAGNICGVTSGGVILRQGVYTRGSGFSPAPVPIFRKTEHVSYSNNTLTDNAETLTGFVHFYLICEHGADPFLFTLRTKLTGAVYCYRSCLSVCNERAACVCVCLFVGLLAR